MEHLTGDLVGLLDHLKIDKAIFVGHDWGGFIVWQMPLRHLDRVAGVVGVNTPHYDRAPADPIELFRKRFGDSMYIVQFQDPAREPDRSSAAGSSRPSMPSCASRCRARTTRRRAAGRGGRRFGQDQSGFPADDRGLRREIRSAHTDPVAGGKEGVRRHFHQDRLYRRHQLVPQLHPQLAALGGLDHTVRVPSLMIMAENDAVLPPSAADGMEKIVPDLEKYLVRDSGHWTQQEKPDEVSAKLIEWRRKRFG